MARYQTPFRLNLNWQLGEQLKATNIDIGAGAFTIMGGGTAPVISPAMPSLITVSDEKDLLE